MAIHFTCPACQTAYAVNDRFAGKKSECKACGQRLQVPNPSPRAKTVLGELVAPIPDSLPLPPEAHSADPEPIPLLPPLPVRARRPLPAGLIAFGVVGAVFLVAAIGVLGLVLVRGTRSDTGRSQSAMAGLGRGGLEQDAKSWEPADLVAALKNRGLAVVTVRGSGAGRFWLVFNGRRYDIRSLHQANMIDEDLVHVEDAGPEFDAAQANRNRTDDMRRTTWAWGRFWFQGDPACLDRVRKALE